ncbi:MAG: DUF5107 domain-containing protein, partial [Anaerolineae bacterium]|nr:DUF5107 domain-containing protein [Anaerolineae bacterium]
TPKHYTAIILENDYVAITVLPELGGRLYRWVDKLTGRRLLYENPVVKPTAWGYRGWWLAAGGIEFAFPVEEHGLNEWRPWAYSVSQQQGAASVTVSDVEDRTGMTVGVRMTLEANSSALQLSPWVSNDTATVQSFQYWLNAMVTLGDNSVSGATRLIFPASRVIVHSTGDEALPDAWQVMDWPIHNGRDLSVYGNWAAYLGFFAPEITQGFAALYDTEADQGIVRAFQPGWPSGTKFFGPGTLSSSLWTDDGSTYVELWSGITPTFANTTTLGPGESVGWREEWYPVHGIGTVTGANADAAVAVTPTGDGVLVSCTTTRPLRGTLVLWVRGEDTAQWEVALPPGEPFRAKWAGQASVEAPLGLSLKDAAGETILSTGSVP